MIKKHLLKGISMGLAVVMITGLIAGCGQKAAAPEKQQAAAEKEDNSPITVEFMLLNNKGADDSQFLAKRIFKEKFNIDAKFILNTKDAHNEKLKLLIASDQLPDVIAPIMDTNAKDIGPKGALVAFDDHFNKLPNLEKLYKQDKAVYTSALASDSHIYFAPRFSETVDFKQVPMIREDLLKKNNLQMPKTMDELATALKTIKAKNPETVGIINRDKTNFVNTLGTFYNTAIGMVYVKEKDTWEFGPLHEGYKELITDMNAMWKDGVIDKDYFTAAAQQWEEKTINGSAVFAMDYGSRATTANDGHKKLKPDDKDFNWTLMMPLTTDSNKKMKLNSAQQVGFFTSWGISSKTKYMDRLLKLTDYMYTDEAATLFQWGEKDKTYVEENGKKKYASNIKASYNPQGTIEADNQLGINNTNFMRLAKDDALTMFSKPVADMFEKYTKETEVYENNYKINLTFNETQQQRINELNVNLNTMVAEATVKFVTGERPMSDFGNYLKELEKNGAKELETINAAAYKDFKDKLSKVK